MIFKRTREAIVKSFPCVPILHICLPSVVVKKMFEGDFADMCRGKFPLICIDGRQLATLLKSSLFQTNTNFSTKLVKYP